MMNRLVAGSTGFGVLALAGCAAAPSGTPTPTVFAGGPASVAPASVAPSPVPTVCPGTPGATPTPCTAAQTEELRTKAALYAEAEEVYRRFFEESGKIGTSDSLESDPVLKLIAGPYVESYKRVWAESRGITTSGPGILAYVTPAPGLSYEGSDVALSSCADGSKETAFDGDKSLGPLPKVRSLTYLKMVDGSLKVWWQQGQVVESC